MLSILFAACKSINSVALMNTGVQGSEMQNKEPDACISSDEVNYLVFRYLMESGMSSPLPLSAGFTHAQFAMQQEAAIHRGDVDKTLVKPGALVAMLQKGLQYTEVEAHSLDVSANKYFLTLGNTTMLFPNV